VYLAVYVMVEAKVLEQCCGPSPWSSLKKR